MTRGRQAVELSALAIVAGLSEIDTGLLPGGAGTGIAALTTAIALVLALVAAPSLSRTLFGATQGAIALRWLVVAVAVGAATSTWSIDPAASAIRSLIALCFIAAAAGVVHRAGFARAVLAIGVALAGVVIGSLVWELVGPGTPVNAATGSHDPGVAGLPRLRGITEHPNQFGRVSGLLVIIGLALRRLDGVRAAVRLSLIVIGSAGLVLSQSRTSMIAVVVALLAFSILDRRWMLPIGAAAAGTATLVLAPLAGISILGLVTRKGQSSELLTATGRSSIWKSAWRLAWEHPLRGSGAFTSPQRMQVAIDAGEVGLDAVDPHNLFLSLFLSGGLVMVGAFLAFLLAIIGRPGQMSGPGRMSGPGQMSGPGRSSADNALVTSARRVLAGLVLWSLTESLLPGLNTNLMLCAVAAAAMIPKLTGADAAAEVDTVRQRWRLAPEQLFAGVAIIIALGGSWAGLQIARSTTPTMIVRQALVIEDVPPHEVPSAHLAISEAVAQSRTQFPNVVPPVDAEWIRPLDVLRSSFALEATATTSARAESTLGLVIGDVDVIEDLGFALTGPRANLTTESNLVQRYRSSTVEQIPSVQNLTAGSRGQADDVDLQDRWAIESRAEVLEIRAATVAGTEHALVERLGLRTIRVGEPHASIPTRRSAVGSLIAPLLSGVSWAGYRVATGRRSAGTPVPRLAVIQ